MKKVDFLKLESTDQNTAIFDIKSHVEMNDEEDEAYAEFLAAQNS